MKNKPDMKGWKLQSLRAEYNNIPVARFVRGSESVEFIIGPPNDVCKHGTLEDYTLSIEEWAAPLLPPENRNEPFFDSMSKPIQTGTIKSINGDKTFDLTDDFVQSKPEVSAGELKITVELETSELKQILKKAKKSIRKETRKNMPFTDEEIKALKSIVRKPRWTQAPE